MVTEAEEAGVPNALGLDFVQPSFCRLLVRHVIHTDILLGHDQDLDRRSMVLIVGIVTITVVLIPSA
jgi:hypothetical protein